MNSSEPKATVAIMDWRLMSTRPLLLVEPVRIHRMGPRPCKVLQVRSLDRSLRSVAVFYLLAFAVSWSIVIPQAAASRGFINLQLPGAVGFLSPLAPMLAAMLMSWRAGGTAEFKRLLRSLLAWRVSRGD